MSRTIVGAGLAGCCLAWQYYFREEHFLLIEDQPQAAGSLAAAGMLAPVTGKAFNTSWRLEEFYDPARTFYSQVERVLGTTLWYDYPVVRPFFDAKDRRKFEKKRLENPKLETYIAEVLEEVPNVQAEHGAVVWQGSGRLNVKAFVEQSRSFFLQRGNYEERSLRADETSALFTTGSRGLVDENPAKLTHRSAKGEILTVRIENLAQDRIISRGTWLVPTGQDDHTFLCGANYDWDNLNNIPTSEGRQVVEKGLRSLISETYEITGHVAGVRPIVRRSEPVIGFSGGSVYLNGLGSKGTLYAPLAAQYVLDNVLENAPLPDFLHYEE